MNQPRVRLYELVAFAFTLACSPHDLPDDQLLTSAHFRYHARADAVLDPAIMDRLEAHRAEFATRFGVEPGMIDYYLFRDNADKGANSPCPAGTSCTQGRAVMASNPFYEHELVHAFLSDTGSPASVVSEGFAQHASCFFPRFAPAVSPDGWPDGVGSAYTFGQRLVSWMLATGGTERLLSFYRRSVPTTDAALFGLQFEGYWGRRISDVAAEMQATRFAGSSCPCTAPPLPPGGSPSSFVAMQDYRTVDVAQESRLELGSSGPLVFPTSCANALDALADVSPTAPVAKTVVRVGAGRFGILGWPTASGETVTVRGTQQPQSDWSCEAAMNAPIEAGVGDIALWVTPESSLDPSGTWFAVNSDGPRALSMLSERGFVFACATCAECLAPVIFRRPSKAIPGGPVVLRLIGAQDADAVPNSVGVLLSHPAP